MPPTILMADDELLRRSFKSVEVNGDFSVALLSLSDASRLRFCHSIGQRTVEALGATDSDSVANQILACIARFRLNGKHLDITFNDGSRWELLFSK